LTSEEPLAKGDSPSTLYSQLDGLATILPSFQGEDQISRRAQAHPTMLQWDGDGFFVGNFILFILILKRSCYAYIPFFAPFYCSFCVSSCIQFVIWVYV